VASAEEAIARPIPPDRLVDDEDEPTVFLTEAQPGGGADDDDDVDGADGADGAPAPAPFAAAGGVGGAAGLRPAVSGPTRRAEAHPATPAQSRLALERFELEALNRWLASGTLFQMRGDIAYLNLASSVRIGFDFRAKLREMGFGRELGLLSADALSGPVLLFQRL
jgi:hypothetical protein